MISTSSAYHYSIYWVFLLGMVMISCKKDKNQQHIPYVDVNITKNIDNPDMIDIKTIGGWTYLTGGSKGILLYRKDQQTIMAYDRHSPYRPEDGCRVSVDSTDVFAMDPCSQSRFLLTDGFPVEGPADRPLLQYNTTFNGSILFITN